MTFGWQLYYRVRPKTVIPGFLGNVSDAAEMDVPILSDHSNHQVWTTTDYIFKVSSTSFSKAPVAEQVVVTCGKVAEPFVLKEMVLLKLCDLP